VSLGAVLSEDDRILDLLDAPIGAAFELDDSKGEFVPITDSLGGRECLQLAALRQSNLA